MANSAAGAVKKKRRLGFASGIKRRWFYNNISVVLASILLVAISAAVFMTNYYYSSVENQLISRAQAISSINQYVTSSEFLDFSQTIVDSFADPDKIELQVLRSGRVAVSTNPVSIYSDPQTAEVRQATESGQLQVFTGYNALTDEKIMAVSIPLLNRETGGTMGVLRLVTSLSMVDRELGQSYLLLIGVAALLSAMILISNMFFIRSIVDPIIKINELAKKIGGGQYGARLDIAFNDEIGELCQTLNDMSAELAKMEKIKNDFISSVSHELRTPLTAINGWAETVSNDLDDPVVATSGLEIIKNETIRLSQMVEELLDFSRLESGELRLHTERFDLRGDLYDAVFIYTEMLKKSGLKVSYEEPGEPIMVFADKNRLKQVFLNIIDNAAKYGSGGDRIEITLRLEGGWCYTEIRDFGQGIPENELPFVKEKFFKGSARGRGTGIGLAVCNEIVIMHGGVLDVESTVGEGTNVTITLPVDTSPEEE